MNIPHTCLNCGSDKVEERLLKYGKDGETILLSCKHCGLKWKVSS